MSVQPDVETPKILQWVATYTYGDAELPDDPRFLRRFGWPLISARFTVVGSGDTFYDEFCKAVDDFLTVVSDWC